MTSIIAGNPTVTFGVPAVESFSIGRDAGHCDIVIHDQHVSRQHARCFWKEDELWMEDLASKTGTKLNGAVLASPARISHGDIIEIGECVLLLQLRHSLASVTKDETFKIECISCPGCGAQSIASFDSCLRCGHSLGESTRAATED